MGRYNPHAPSILGQEWSPIRDTPYALDSEVERGHTFVLDTSTTIVSGSFFLDDVPPAASRHVVNMNVYRRGEEHLTGPIKKLVVPCDSVTISGTETGSVVGASTAVQALQSPSDGAYIGFVQGSNDLTDIELGFDTNTFSAQLSGKRILDVRILLGIAGGRPISRVRDFLVAVTASGQLPVIYAVPVITTTSIENISELSQVPIGNTNLWTLPGMIGEPRKYPIRYPDLQRYENGATNELTFLIEITDYGFPEYLDGFIDLTYAAMEVTYCEETRLLYGGIGYPEAIDGSTLTGITGAPHIGQNVVQLRPSDTFAVTGKVLTPGEYTVTVTSGEIGDFTLTPLGPNYTMKAIDQLYALPTHKGVEIVTSRKEGATFTQREINLLPQLALHTSSLPVTGVHVFGQQAVGNVYDSVDVAPDVVAKSNGAAVPFPQVRFYARRFGDTTGPLILRQQSAPTRLVSITADEFDALPEIVDGWREVTLRFADSLVPTYANSGGVTWEWIADGVDAGNQWQVLTPRGESLSTLPYDTDRATYGGVTAFTLITGQSLDASADSTLIFSQDPPMVTGFAVDVEEQSLEPVGRECDLDPACIPTALQYHHLSWDALDVLDTFEERTAASGWGETPCEQLWTHSGGTLDDYFVVTGAAHTVVDAVNTLYFSTIEARAYNVETRARVRVPVMPAGGALTLRVLGRVEDTSNYYEGQISIQTTGVVLAAVTKRVATVGSTISPVVTLDAQHQAGDTWNLAIRCQAEQLLFKAWKEGYPEPLQWQAVAVTALGDDILGTQAGVVIRAETGFSNGTFVADWLDFSATNLDIVGFEVQRSDEVDDEWQTIMRSTGTAVCGFNDYEARVGYQSYYRIRTFNALEFYGSWTLDETTTHYNWDASAQGWVGEGTTSVAWDPAVYRDGTGSLRATETMGAAFDELRFNDAMGGSTRDLSALGTTLTSWILIPADARGTGWQGRMEVQDPGFTWQPGPNYPLIKGLWLPLSYTPALSLLQNCRSIGFAIGATGVNAVQSINVDTLLQGTGLSTVGPPGVVGAGEDGNSVLLFTTNERQDGSSNLAYVQTWSGDPTEDFAYPEAGTVQLRNLYQRDFPVVFKPTERGGERFSRDLLVQNAVVPSGRLRDGFRSLRDMAWQDVSYVAVRNELGDRWLANVQVPSGKIQRNRRIYIAQVNIAEVAEVPSAVDPAEESPWS